MESRLLWRHDRALLKDYPLIAGVDEAGRGTLAGSVVAACVVLDYGMLLDGINDSKKLSAKNRRICYNKITAAAKAFGLGECTPGEVDRYNILQATFIAMARAVKASGVRPDLVLVDGNNCIPGLPFRQQCLVKGDGRSAAVAAASILAKVTRDAQMEELHKSFPQYGFDQNRGYGTSQHLNAIKCHGYSPVHRKTFRPVSLLQTSLFSNE
jgi:ribonuclease HII